MPGVVITDDLLNRAREQPAGEVLQELGQFRFFLRKWMDDDDRLIHVAERLLTGDLEIPGRPAIEIALPFDPDDLDKLPRWTLQLAGFIVPEIFLRAYQITGREVFFEAAREVILAWAQFEGSAWLPRGSLWNDHAIAARVPVLGEFWRLYRNHPDYRPEEAKIVFQLVARSAQLLAKPGHFTYATNHGVMQNLALWHLCLAFPTLPNTDRHKQLALKRMRDQMVFYVSSEGVVLEHSAGYHAWGLQVIGMALRYLTLLNEQIPADWREKYERAKMVYAQLRRPDGSLPVFGDTARGSDPEGPPVTNLDARGWSGVESDQDWVPKQSYALYPVAGYSIWWDALDHWQSTERLSQTVVLWSHFPSQAHKHADEMSVLLWAGGQSWWTNLGYWPSGVTGRSQAVSWDGSNAPHLVDETYDTVRETRLVSSGWSEEIAVVDLERSGPNNYAARRQVVHLQPNVWAIIDSTSGGGKSRTTTTWTTSHKVDLRKGSFARSYILESKERTSSLTKFILSSGAITIQEFRGSVSPFAGWAVVNRIPTPAWSIVVTQPANDSWAATVWLLSKGTDPAGTPSMVHWGNAEDWTLRVPLESGFVEISREGNGVLVSNDKHGGGGKVVRLSREVGHHPGFGQIRAAYASMARKYPRFRVLLKFRAKITYLLLVIFLLQEIFFGVLGRFVRKYYVLMRIVNVSGWAVVGIWLFLTYFRV